MIAHLSGGREEGGDVACVVYAAAVFTMGLLVDTVHLFNTDRVRFMQLSRRIVSNINNYILYIEAETFAMMGDFTLWRSPVYSLPSPYVQSWHVLILPYR